MAIDVFGLPVRQPRKLDFLRDFGVGFLRLIVPSLILSFIYIVSFYLQQQPAGVSFVTKNALANPAWWMTAGHLSLSVAFFAVALTNRARGAVMAFGQVLMSWSIIAGILGFAVHTYGLDTIRAELFPTAKMMAFVAAMFVAHLMGVLVFDWQRGVPWWRAPLVAAIVAPLIFVLIYYPFSHVGMDAPWTSWMWMDFVAKAIVGVVLLVPYNWLRGMMRPDPGLGGA